MRKLPCVIAIAISSFPLVAAAQIWSDQVPLGRTVPLKESVERQMSDSRWKWGPFRVEPAVKLANIGYNDNVFGTEEDKVDDYTATVGLGVRTIAPIGSKMFLRLDAVPEYTWYNELEERRQFGWSAGGALLGLFNRMQVELGATTYNTVTAVNSEELTPVPQQDDRLHARIEFDVLRRLSLFVAAEERSTDYEPEEGDPISVNLLERDESAQRVGLRYQFRPEINLHTMYEEYEAEFPNDPTYPSNEGDAMLFGATYDAERFFLNAIVGRRAIRYEGPGAPEYDEPTGSGFLSMQLFGRSQLRLQFRKKPVYSTFVENPFYEESRWGLGVDVPMGHRLIVLADLETGANDYPGVIELPDGSSVVREDDVDTWSAGVGFRVSSLAVLEVRYRVEEYTSTIESFDRDIASLQVNLALR